MAAASGESTAVGVSLPSCPVGPGAGTEPGPLVANAVTAFLALECWFWWTELGLVSLLICDQNALQETIKGRRDLFFNYCFYFGDFDIIKSFFFPLSSFQSLPYTTLGCLSDSRSHFSLIVVWSCVCLCVCVCARARARAPARAHTHTPARAICVGPNSVCLI